MRLVTFSRDGGAAQAGVISGDKISALGSDMISVIASGKPWATGPFYNLRDVALLAPVPRPNKLICVGLNYRDHAAETEAEIPEFRRYSTSSPPPSLAQASPSFCRRFPPRRTMRPNSPLSLAEAAAI